MLNPAPKDSWKLSGVLDKEWIFVSVVHPCNLNLYSFISTPPGRMRSEFSYCVCQSYLLDVWPNCFCVSSPLRNYFMIRMAEWKHRQLLLSWIPELFKISIQNGGNDIYSFTSVRVYVQNTLKVTSQLLQLCTMAKNSPSLNLWRKMTALDSVTHPKAHLQPDGFFQNYCDRVLCLDCNCREYSLQGK